MLRPMAAELDNRQLKYLRGLGHGLKPVVMVGQRGLTESVLAEIEGALEQHELIKVKLRGDREARLGWIETIAGETGAILVNRIGQTACFYRRHPKKPKLALPHGKP